MRSKKHAIARGIEEVETQATVVEDAVNDEVDLRDARGSEPSCVSSAWHDGATVNIGRKRGPWFDSLANDKRKA